MKHSRFVVPALLLAATGSLSASAVSNTAASYTVINTAPFWNGTDWVGDFGAFDGPFPGISSFGQTITVPKDNVLDSFSFYMDILSDLTFSGYVFRWNGSSATGPELFKSVATNTKQGFVFPNPPRFERVTFNTGGLALTAGQYILFASAAEYHYGQGGIWGAIPSDVYTGGEAVYTDSTNISEWTTAGSWSPLGGRDFAFDATFAVPEPSTFVVVAGALFALALFRYRQS